MTSALGSITSGATPAGLLEGRSVPFLSRVLLLLYCFFGAQQFPLLESPEDLEASMILVHLWFYTCLQESCPVREAQASTQECWEESSRV